MKERLDDLDHLIDRTLTGLRDAQPSATLESRILRTLETRTQPESDRPRWLLWAAPAAAALALATALIVWHQQPSATPPTTNRVTPPPVARSLAAPSSTNSAFTHYAQPSHTLTPRTLGLLPSTETPATDPEAALALAETRAPSRLAPDEPLTQQERILLRATRSGELSELAELQPSREAALRAALESRQSASIQQYIQQILAPLATSEAIHPSDPADPAPDPARDLPPSDLASDPPSEPAAAPPAQPTN